MSIRALTFTIFLLLWAALGTALAQSLPVQPIVSFAWDEPTNTVNIMSYRLQWRTGSVLLPVGTTNETVQYFPSGFNEKVGISSVRADGVESETNSISLMSVLAHFQSNRGDGSAWVTRTSLWFVIQLESNEMFRVKLEAK